MYYMRRVIMAVPVALCVAVLVSIIVQLVPGDPVTAILGPYSSESERIALRQTLGLNLSVSEQILRYLEGILHFDFGESLIQRRPVAELVGDRILATIELAIGSIIVCIFLAIPTGILSAVFYRRAIDSACMLFSLIGVALPNFWLGPMLILIFSVQLDLLPTSGRGGLLHFILPCFTMGSALSGMLSRITRNAIIEVKSLPFVTTAKAKGLSHSVILGKHILRNAALPITSVLGLQLGILMTGAVITEAVFAWPGLGSLMLEALNQRDYPLIQGCILLFCMFYIAVNLLTDFAYSLLDPKIQYH